MIFNKTTEERIRGIIGFFFFQTKVDLKMSSKKYKPKPATKRYWWYLFLSESVV